MITMDGILRECYRNQECLKSGLQYFWKYSSMPSFFSSMAVYIVTDTNDLDLRKISFLPYLVASNLAWLFP